MFGQDVFELRYAKMPDDSAGEESEADSNAGTSLAAQSDDDSNVPDQPAGAPAVKEVHKWIDL